MSAIKKNAALLLWAVPIAAILLCAVAFASGLRPLVVVGASMEPTIHVGSVLLFKSVEASAVRRGDVITYVSDGSDASAAGTNELTTHRVVSVESVAGSPAFRTRGDANDSTDDGLVAASAVLGRAVVVLPYVGALTQIARTRVGFLALIALPALVFVGVELASIFRELRRPRIRTQEGQAR